MKESSNETILNIIQSIETRLQDRDIEPDEVVIPFDRMMLSTIRHKLKDVLKAEHDGQVYTKDCKR